MAEHSDSNRVAAAVVIGLCLAVGLSAGGWLIGTGMARFKSDLRRVTVKGLVEREVGADQAVWALSFRRASDALPDAHAKISADREAVLAFLRKRGFVDTELESRPTRTLDKFARDYGESQNVRLRYVVDSAVLVKTANVDLVKASAGATEQLLKEGVALDAPPEGRANPRYTFSRFNEMRPQLLADATKNARAIAQQFAADSGATVGRIYSANQGNIQIFGSDGNDESAPYSPTSTPAKKIRVVSTFEFELK